MDGEYQSLAHEATVASAEAESNVLLDLRADPQALYRRCNDKAKSVFIKASYQKLHIDVDEHTHAPVVVHDQVRHPLTPLHIATRTYTCGQRKSGASAESRGTANHIAQCSKIDRTVELMVAYCNSFSQVKRLIERVCGPQSVDGHDPGPQQSHLVPARPWALRRRLHPDDVDAIVAGFLAGQRQADLATRFEISRSSIKRLLRERGARRYA